MMSCSTSETKGPDGAVISRRGLYLRWLAVLSLSVVIVIHPAAFWQALMFAAQSLWLVSPMILTGLLLTALMLASHSMQLIARAFTGRELSMILWASLVGAVTPVCGATVLPLVAALLIARVPLAPVMAFWLASPITDPAMLSLTVATLGWPLAIAKTAGSVGAGVFGGLVVLLLTSKGSLNSPLKTGSQLQRFSCAVPDEEQVILWRFWTDPARTAVFFSSIKSNGRLMLVWLSVAFMAEYYMQAFVPLDWLPEWFGTDTVWAVPLAALIGAPIYLDGYAALPLVRGLIDAGMSQAAALTFLVAGGITSAWAAIPVFVLVRGRVFILYLMLAFLASVLVGFIGGLFL